MHEIDWEQRQWELYCRLYASPGAQSIGVTYAHAKNATNHYREMLEKEGEE